MKKNIFLIIFICFFTFINAQTDIVTIDKSDVGLKLKVNANDFIINGMNWDYCPIGNNYSYSLWKQSDDIIKEALEDEMSLLKNMGVNTIRVYSDIPKKWISNRHYISQSFHLKW